MADQAQQHALLTRVRDIGVRLLGLRVVGGDPQPSSPTPALEHPLRNGAAHPARWHGPGRQPTFAYRRLESVGLWLTELPTDVDQYRATFAEPRRLAATIIVEQRGGHGGTSCSV